MLVGAGVVSWFLLSAPLCILVVHYLPCCGSVGMWSVGLLFPQGALDSHPFSPSRAVSGHCVVTATMARVPAGVVSALAEPSSWHTGVVLVGAGSFYVCCCPLPSALRPSTTRLAALVCAAQHFCTHTMRSLTCVSVVVCVARKPCPCPSYSSRRDRIYLGLGGLEAYSL